MIINFPTNTDSEETYHLLSEERQASLQEWINIHLKPYEIKSFNEYHCSALIKIAFPCYLTNGEIKGAMLAAGFKVKDRSKKNWSFNVSKKQCNYLLQDKKII